MAIEEQLGEDGWFGLLQVSSNPLEDHLEPLDIIELERVEGPIGLLQEPTKGVQMDGALELESEIRW
jgi:hypothetical protein